MLDNDIGTKELSTKYESLDKTLEDARVASGTANLILLGVALKDCPDYIREKSGKNVAPQSLRTRALKEGGVGNLFESLLQKASELPLEERQRVFKGAREFAKQKSPLTVWRMDPGIDYCIAELIAETCTEDFTVTQKAKVIEDVLRGERIIVQDSTIRKVLEKGGYKPDLRLKELYTNKELEEMKKRATEIIHSSRKQRADSLRFEAPLWKDRQLCISLAEAITQGASVYALSVMARSNEHTFSPSAFQQFMRRSKTEIGAINTDENRKGAVDALRDLHTITDAELQSVRSSVERFLAEYKKAVSRDMARINDLVRGAQALAGLAVLRNNIASTNPLPPGLITFKSEKMARRRVLVATVDANEVTKLRADFAAKLKSGVSSYKDGHPIIDYDNLMYVLRKLNSLEVSAPPGEYKKILAQLKVGSIEVREARPAMKEPVLLSDDETSVNDLFGPRGGFVLPPDTVVGQSQFTLRTMTGELLRDTVLSDAPLKVVFRKAHYNDRASAEYAADIIDDSNFVVATLICTRGEEGLYDWLSEHGVRSLQLAPSVHWMQEKNLDNLSSTQRDRGVQDVAE